MTLLPQADPVPLRMDERGTLRVGDSRVTLDVLIEEYEGGAAPEALVQAFDTLNLADTYAVLAYYLRHRDEVNAYLQRREVEAEEIERKLEAQGMIWPEARDILTARRDQGGENGHASPRQ